MKVKNIWLHTGMLIIIGYTSTLYSSEHALYLTNIIFSHYFKQDKNSFIQSLTHMVGTKAETKQINSIHIGPTLVFTSYAIPEFKTTGEEKQKILNEHFKTSYATLYPRVKGTVKISTHSVALTLYSE